MFYNVVLFVLQGAVNWVLSWRGFLPLSRLSFVVYLIHPVVMVLFIYNKKVLINMNTLEMVSQIFAYKQENKISNMMKNHSSKSYQINHEMFTP